MIDATGQLVSENDLREALDAVNRSIVRDMMKLPPELAVQLPNIHRCLLELANVKLTGTIGSSPKVKV